MKGIIFTVLLTFPLVGCSGPQFVNQVHPDHPEILQNVSTSEKAQREYSNLTQFIRIGAENDIVLQTQDGPTVFEANPTHRVIYTAANGNAYFYAEGRDAVQTGTWRIEQFGRGYPRLCISLSGEGQDEFCSWPAGIYSGRPDRNRAFKGDVFGLSNLQIPGSFRSIGPGSTLASIQSRQGITAPNIARLGPIR